MSDEKDELLIDGSESEDGEAGDSGSDNSAPPDNKDAAEGSDQRVNDLMSKWQAEQAKASKLQKELDALKSKPAPASKSKPASQSSSAQADEFVQFARESARKQLFDSDPRLAEYGLDIDAIAGDTLPEMKASMKAQLALVSGIETRARNRILAEHGLDPDVSTGQSSEKAPSFSTMNDKDFAEFLAMRDAQRR